mgnify:CR=1 FL=1
MTINRPQKLTRRESNKELWHHLASHILLFLSYGSITLQETIRFESLILQGIVQMLRFLSIRRDHTLMPFSY